MNGTTQQMEIWNEIENGSNHVMVNAGAGTGKTYTIVEGAKLCSGKMAFLCFNKSIQLELAKRLPEGVNASTFHAMGMKALRASGLTRMDKNKNRTIIEGVLGKDYNWFPLSKLIGLVKGSMVDANNTSHVRQLIDKYNIQFTDDEDERLAINRMPLLIQRSLESKSFDFDDMIWMPLALNLAMPKYDVIFVDEAQDFNESQRQLIYRSVEPDGRCIIVGDKNQAIYGFRGADSSSMAIFEELLNTTNRGVSKFPLTLSWRCPTSVVTEANRFVKDFEGKEDAIEGSVSVNAAFNPVKGDIALCRYNAPLVSAFYSLITQGKSAYILGRDMTKGLVSHVKKVSGNNMSMTSHRFADDLAKDFRYQYDKLVAKEKTFQANALEDKVECLNIFADKASSVGGIIKEIQKVFDSKGRGDIMLSTVHKAKGLEADNVYLLATERMPHPKTDNMQEEMNICYVAITRAKVNLFYCGPKPAERVV
jgi:superfamily I DNA/RNA helicase